MHRSLASCFVAVALVACGPKNGGSDGSTGGGHDLSMPGCTTNCGSNDDLSMPGGDTGDMAMPQGGPEDLTMPQMMGTTIHDIALGNVADKTPVTVSGAVVIGVANGEGHAKTSTMKCKYTAYVQDPNFADHAGVELFVSGAPCTPVDGGACKCPYPPNSGTVLDQVANLGDIYTVNGTVSVFSPTTDAGLQPPQYEIVVTSLTKTGSGGTVTPVVVSSSADIAQFAHNGTGYDKYQSMLIQVKPAAPAMASALDQFKGFTYAGAAFSGDYNFTYSMMNMYPGTKAWSSIQGIAEPNFGGGIAPRVSSDFQP